jgi:hypothetical protein
MRLRGWWGIVFASAVYPETFISYTDPTCQLLYISGKQLGIEFRI